MTHAEVEALAALESEVAPALKALGQHATHAGWGSSSTPVSLGASVQEARARLARALSRYRLSPPAAPDASLQEQLEHAAEFAALHPLRPSLALSREKRVALGVASGTLIAAGFGLYRLVGHDILPSLLWAPSVLLFLAQRGTRLRHAWIGINAELRELVFWTGWRRPTRCRSIQLGKRFTNLYLEQRGRLQPVIVLTLDGPSSQAAEWTKAEVAQFLPSDLEEARRLARAVAESFQLELWDSTRV